MQHQLLPVEILIEIYSYLSPEEINRAQRVSKKFQSQLKEANYLWEYKYKQHFPASYNKIINNDEKPNNWYAKFMETYNKDYANLDQLSRIIFSAAKENDIEKLKTLDIQLEHLAMEDANGTSILSWARDHDNKEMLDLFYQASQKIYTKLYWAIACKQSMDEIIHLLEQGSRIDEEYSLNETNPVHVAANVGHLDFLQYLLNTKPSSLNQTGSYGQTPLFCAVSGNQLEIIEYLLKQNGINLNAAINDQSTLSWQGKTALHLAAEKGCSKAAKALIDAGAQIDATTTSMHFQPLHYAAMNGHLEVVKLFIEHNPHILNNKDKLMQTPLIWASSKGHPSVVQYLLAQKDIKLEVASAIYRDELHTEYTALHWAAEEGHAESVKLLIGAGANTNASTYYNRLPLHLAASNGHFEIVTMLIENNPASINAVDVLGQTALLLASAKNHPHIVDYLLKHGANMNIPSQHDKTPLDWAYERQHNTVIDILESYPQPDLNALAPAEAIKWLNKKYNPLITATISNIEILFAATESRANSLFKGMFFTQQRLSAIMELRNVLHQIQRSDKSPVEKVGDIAIQIAKTYNQILIEMDKEITSRKSETVTQLFTTIRKLCDRTHMNIQIDPESNCILKITRPERMHAELNFYNANLGKINYRKQKM